MKIIEFLNGPNFMKLSYLLATGGLLMAGFVNKRELIHLYEITLQACF